MQSLEHRIDSRSSRSTFTPQCLIFLENKNSVMWKNNIECFNPDRNWCAINSYDEIYLIPAQWWGKKQQIFAWNKYLNNQRATYVFNYYLLYQRSITKGRTVYESIPFSRSIIFYLFPVLRQTAHFQINNWNIPENRGTSVLCFGMSCEFFHFNLHRVKTFLSNFAIWIVHLHTVAVLPYICSNHFHIKNQPNSFIKCINSKRKTYDPNARNRWNSQPLCSFAHFEN